MHRRTTSKTEEMRQTQISVLPSERIIYRASKGNLLSDLNIYYSIWKTCLFQPLSPANPPRLWWTWLDWDTKTNYFASVLIAWSFWRRIYNLNSLWHEMNMRSIGNFVWCLTQRMHNMAFKSVWYITWSKHKW